MAEMTKQVETPVIPTIFRITVQRSGNHIWTIWNVISTALQIRVLLSQTTYLGLFFFQFKSRSSSARYVSIFKHMPRPCSNKEICNLRIPRVPAKPETVSQKQFSVIFNLFCCFAEQYSMLLWKQTRNLNMPLCAILIFLHFHIYN